MKWKSILCLFLLLVFSFVFPTSAKAAPPLVPGIGLIGDFEVGKDFNRQLTNFYRRYPREREEISTRWRGANRVVIPAYGLSFRLNNGIVMLIVCKNPKFIVADFNLAVDDNYIDVATELGRPNDPANLANPRDGLGRVWYYDYDGIAFDIDEDGKIQAILIYPPIF